MAFALPHGLPAPLPTVGVALLLMAGLAYHATEAPPAIAVAAASEHEGSGPVRIVAVALEPRPLREGVTRFRLVDAGYALPAQAPVPTLLAGQVVDAVGRLARLGGELTFVVDRASDVTVRDPTDAPSPSWAQVAADPGAWTARPVWLAGNADATTLRDGDGHRVQLGTGEWPRGPTRALGTLRYDAACLCHRFDLVQVAAWTS